MKVLLCLTVLTLRSTTISGQVNLVQPETIDSASGFLNTTLTIEYADFSGAAFSVTNARLLNGIIPGPTLRLNAGDTLRILFENKLSEQAGAISSGDNEFHNPDHSNLHFHGGHVSGELPSDDIRMSVAPGESFQYETKFPDNHLPGTHWIHPHVHGSSALQVGAGAALAMIVMDPADFLPTQVEDATDILLLVQNIDQTTSSRVATEIGDSMLDIQIDGDEDQSFRLVNGLYQPTTTMQPGEWQRWRIVFGNWLVDTLDFAFDASSTCEMHLLAKDGIYIQDYPRAVDLLPIPTGGRADIMVRCPDAGEYTVTNFDDQVLMKVTVEGSALSSADLEAWSPDYPAYLTDLTSTTPTNGCDCDTSFRGCDGKFCINNNLFDANVYLHTVEFGSVVERVLAGVNRHPYHQHVYPFQLVGGVDSLSDADVNTYFQTGDWHDVVRIDTNGDVNVRYKADVHDGVVMLHCHILTHEDEGTMSQELVLNDDGTCECDALYTVPGGPTASPTTSVDDCKTPFYDWIYRFLPLH